MGFFKEIRTQYGEEAVATLKCWSCSMKKLALLKNQRTFLISCRREGILPDHFQHRFDSIFSALTNFYHPFVNNIKKTIDNFNKKILNLEIKIIVFHINSLEQLTNTCKNQALAFLPLNVSKKYEETIHTCYNRIFVDIKNKHISKLMKLKRRNTEVSTLNPNTNEENNWLLNMTNTEIPDSVKDMLRLGPKFSVEHLYSELPMLH